MASVQETAGISVNALMQEYDTITHNLANASTTGYKRRVNAFSQILDKATNGDRPAGKDGPGVTLGIDFSQGHSVQTGRNLDLALQGEGFFVVETPAGPLYTRNGMFQVNGMGQIVDSQGRIIAGEGGPIVIPKETPTSTVNVSDDGKVSAGGLAIGRFRVVEFADKKTELNPVGMNCFTAAGGEGPKPAKASTVKQGYQENSNVNTMEELVGLITVTRVYEANMKVLTSKSEAGKSMLSVAMG
jgi:flagellar basal-body rod protein FlgF